MKLLRPLFCYLFVFIALSSPAKAIIGGAPATYNMSRTVVMLVSSNGLCSATVIGINLLLTAGHCIHDKGELRVLATANGKKTLLPVAASVVHPQFRADAYKNRLFSIDLGLIVLKAPLQGYDPLPISPEAGMANTYYDIAGFGISSEDTEGSDGKLNEIRLPSVGPFSAVQLRLSAKGRVAGSCNGDSGGPAIRNSWLIGILTSSASFDRSKKCGGVTGITLIGQALPWIRDTAYKFGATLR